MMRSKSIARMLAVATAALACTSAVGFAAVAVVQPQSETITWSVFRAKLPSSGDNVQLTIESRWNSNSRSMWSNDHSLGELTGFSPAQLDGASGPVRFALARDAGRLDCSGTAGRMTGKGVCSFTPDGSFGEYLRARGMGYPTRQEAFS